jgi:hypothetical protein
MANFVRYCTVARRTPWRAFGVFTAAPPLHEGYWFLAQAAAYMQPTVGAKISGPAIARFRQQTFWGREKEKRIDQATYERQRDKLREESTLLEIELHGTRVDELDVEGLPAFAEEILTHASRLWFEAVPEQKARLQRVFFPEGISFDGKAFGTAVTCLAFSDLQEIPDRKNGLASPTGLATPVPFGRPLPVTA